MMGFGLLAASLVALSPLEANATRIEYYATVGEPLCELNFVRSGLGFCDVSVGSGVDAPRGELINVHYTARFADGTVFDSSYKRGRPLTMRIGVGKVIRGLDQGIFGVTHMDQNLQDASQVTAIYPAMLLLSTILILLVSTREIGHCQQIDRKPRSSESPDFPETKLPL
ncbi:photosynthetic NDH subunit of lumenal location 4 chloroplastic isoform X2 [Prunus yedoensis var. nudiflora]|uniref:peptidylprolyl isomerase n=1 Tax=Prunus yedoensis var. nudiflora TaxID=2094558 RepID=A0A314UM02_PRUYE|nr:photosynthetic NDH subunit of lumenal location 4 chloroplastic isoform X2 [Prunus yedoensis var. nudiflora]